MFLGLLLDLLHRPLRPFVHLELLSHGLLYRLLNFVFFLRRARILSATALEKKKKEEERQIFFHPLLPLISQHDSIAEWQK